MQEACKAEQFIGLVQETDNESLILFSTKYDVLVAIYQT